MKIVTGLINKQLQDINLLKNVNFPNTEKYYKNN